MAPCLQGQHRPPAQVRVIWAVQCAGQHGHVDSSPQLVLDGIYAAPTPARRLRRRPWHASAADQRPLPRAVAKSPYTRLTSSNAPVDRLAPRVVRGRGVDRLTITSL